MEQFFLRRRIFRRSSFFDEGVERRIFRRVKGDEGVERRIFRRFIIIKGDEGDERRTFRR